jgi:hypothetical protein
VRYNPEEGGKKEINEKPIVSYLEKLNKIDKLLG